MKFSSVLCSLYASIAGGTIERLKVRGRAQKDAEAESAFALASCSMINLLTLLLLLEPPGLGHTVPFYIWGMLLYIASQRLHRRLFRPVAIWATFSPKLWARRSAYSLAYLIVSLGALGLVVAYKWAVNTRVVTTAILSP